MSARREDGCRAKLATSPLRPGTNLQRTRTVFLLATLTLAPAVASAQRYRADGPDTSDDPPSATLSGGVIGVDLGVGGIAAADGDLDCFACDSSPAGHVAGHLGRFLGPRLALMAEVQGNVQTLESQGDAGRIDHGRVVQSALMVAGQYWVTPRLWIKHGLGVAVLVLDEPRSDGAADEMPRIETGLANLNAIGYEVLSAPAFSIDVQGRILFSLYEDTSFPISTLGVGVGINWY